MLTNAISSGTSPRKCSDTKISHKGILFHCEQKSSLPRQDKKLRYNQDHTKITENCPNPENLRTSSNVAKSNAERSLCDNSVTSVPVRKISYKSERKVSFSTDSGTQNEIIDQDLGCNFPGATWKITEDCLGFSVDSNLSSIDVFESFDTVSEISTLSQFSDGEKIEKCFLDISKAKLLQETAAERLMVCNDELSLIPSYDRFYYDVFHGSFSNISLQGEPTGRLQSYGIRDLKSETSLSDLKEHILCAERNKSPRTNNPQIFPLSVTRKGSKASSCDVLLSLSAGYTFLEKSAGTRYTNQNKIFSSLQNIDSETSEMSYFDSITYLKKRDVESCRASGPGLKHGTAGQKATFYIFSDKDNTRLLKVYVEGPRLMPPKIEFSCLAEGFYSVNYWPDRVGWYTVNVLWKGTHISGSPFNVLMLLPKRTVWIKRCDF